MNARKKLNQSYVNGALLIAGIIGGCTESWTAFIVMAVLFVGLSIHTGEIRTSPTTQRHQQRGRRD